MSAPTNDPTTPTQNPTSSFPETAYADALVPAKPKDSLALIQNRLRKARTLTEELADYFSARRELEDSYLKALSKLSKRPFLTDASVLGPGFSMVYERLISELGETASVHSELEKKIADECEMPFRVMANKGEWGRVKEYDDSLASTIKEINSLESQLQKDQKKAETASSKKASTLHSKAVDTERSLQSSLDDWETEAPFAFEAYQRIDRNRLEAMKEIVTKFETAQADAAQRLMSITENSMQVALGFEPEREMKNWLRTNSLPKLRATSGAGGASSRNARSNGDGSRGEREGTPASMMSSNTYTTNGGTVRPNNGNVISEFGAASRNHPANQSRSSLASGHQMESLSTTSSRPGQAPQSSSANAAPPLPASSEKSSSGGSTLKNAFSRIGRGRANKDKNDMNTVYGTLNEDAGPSTERTSTSTARGNMGPPDRPATSRTTNEERSTGFGSAAAVGAGAGVAAGGLMQPMLPTRGGSGSSQVAQSIAPQVDAEGYSIPPPDRKPWEAGGSGSSNNLMDDGNNEVLDEGFTAPNPLRASSMNISSNPIQTGDQAGDKEALERVKSTLLTARSPSAGPTRRNTTRRDRRDVRATTYNPTLPSTDSSDGSRPMSQFGLPMISREPGTIGGSSSPPGGQSQSQFNSGFNGAPGLGDHRSQSIVSMSSAANPFDVSSSTLGVGAAGGAISSSTGLGSSGLRGSITETVNALFNGRELARILVVGELSLSLKDIPASQASSPLHLRIESFEQLEKAAPNPQFLKPVEGAHGEYWLDTPALLALSAGQANGATAVVLKYQLHVSESSKETYLPLQVHTQWRCEPHQTSLLLTYTPTSNSRISEPTPTSIHTSTTTSEEPILTDLSFLTGIEPVSTNVTNVMSKPTGTWSAEKKKIMWRLNENVSLTNPITSKVLARFQVDSVTVAQPTQIKWKVQGRTVSKIDVSLVGNNEGSSLKFEEIRRNCVSGKFIANP